MLNIINLHVEIAGNPVLKGVNLHIKQGETFILFGPNGSGKTSLLMTLMGFSSYKITAGKIIFNGKDITEAPMYERARLGIGMSFQRPPTIHGLTLGNLLKLCAPASDKPDLHALASDVNFERFLDRDVNAGFSGGEIKRSELLQLMVQQPGLVLFDEPESGVDLENMAVIGNAVKNLLDGCNGKECRAGKQKKRSGLIITHTGYILDYINADRGEVLLDGKLCCEGRPGDILNHVRAHGYKGCMNCLDEQNGEMEHA